MKYVPTIHPAALMRDPTLWGAVVGDLQRAHTESASPFYTPEACEVYHVTGDLDTALAKLPAPGPTALDIETWFSPLDLVGLCGAPPVVYVVEGELILEQSRVFQRWLDTQTLLIHNALFDVDRLERLGFRIPSFHDTMLLHHTVYAELPHSLAFVASTFTRLPYWKGMVRDAAEVLEK